MIKPRWKIDTDQQTAHIQIDAKIEYELVVCLNEKIRKKRRRNTVNASFNWKIEVRKKGGQSWT